MNNAKNIAQMQPVNIVEIFNDDLTRFQEFCKQQPDAVPTYIVVVQNKLNWMVGAWWCSLDEGQKTKAYENHPEFSKMYPLNTSKNYGSIFNRLPTSYRYDVIQNLGIAIGQTIVNATNDDEEKQFLINLAIDKKFSKRVMEEFIKLWKDSKPLGYQVVRELPTTGKVSKQMIEDCRFKAKKLFGEELEKAKSELEPEVKEKVVTQVVEDTKSKKSAEKSQKEAEMAKRALTGVQQENQKLIEQNQRQQRQFEKMQAETAKLKEKLAMQQTQQTISDNLDELKRKAYLYDQQQSAQHNPNTVVDLDDDTPDPIVEAAKRVKKQDDKKKEILGDEKYTVFEALDYVNNYEKGILDWLRILVEIKSLPEGDLKKSVEILYEMVSEKVSKK